MVELSAGVGVVVATPVISVVATADDTWLVVAVSGSAACRLVKGRAETESVVAPVVTSVTAVAGSSAAHINIATINKLLRTYTIHTK